MNTIEISDDLVLQHNNYIDQPVIIHLYTHQPYRNESFEIKNIQVLVQIFHTELKHFDLRKATLIDPDERRPIYGFTFDSVEKHMAFLLKRLRYMLAFQQVDHIEVDGEIVIGASHTSAQDLNRLRSFIAWLEHITGEIECDYVNDCSVIEINGGSMLKIPDITFDDLIACLKGEKPLVRKEPKDDLTSKEGITVDGVKLKPDEIQKHMSQKAMLERMEECVAN